MSLAVFIISVFILLMTLISKAIVLPSMFFYPEAGFGYTNNEKNFLIQTWTQPKDVPRNTHSFSVSLKFPVV